MNSDGLSEKHRHRGPIQTSAVVVEGVAGWQDQSDDGFLHSEAPQFGVYVRKYGFPGTGAHDDQQFGRDIADQSQDIYAGGVRDRRQYNRDKQQATRIELRDQFSESQERGQAEFSDRKGNRSKRADRSDIH